MSRVRADRITNRAGTGAPNFPNGLTGAAATFTVLTYDDVTNIDSVGLITARTGIEVSGIVTARPGFAVTYYGDGTFLTGVVSGIEIEEGGTSVGASLTAINFASGATVTQGSSGITTVSIAAGISTAASVASGAVVTLNLSDAQDHKITATGICTITCTGGTEGDSHTIRIVNSGIATVGFSTYFLFPSGATPSLPTTNGAIHLVSCTVHRQGGVGISTQLLSGASLNYN